jgi:hypothetical protein
MSNQAQLSAVFQDEIPNLIRGESLTSFKTPLSSRVRVPQHNSSWIIQLSDRFSELTSLPRGWDGYSGLPVSFDRAQFAANLIERICIEGIPAPQLVPGSDGTIQIEWHVNQFDIEIDVLAPYNVTATRFDYISEEEEEIELQADFTALAKWVSELGQSRTYQQQEAQVVVCSALR